MVPAKHTVDGMSKKIFDERRKSFTGGNGTVPLPTFSPISVTSPLHARRNSAAAVESSRVVGIQVQKQVPVVTQSEVAIPMKVEEAVEVSVQAAVESRPASWDFGRFFRCFRGQSKKDPQQLVGECAKFN